MKSLITEIIPERLGPTTADFPDAQYQNEAAGVLPTPVLSQFMSSYHYHALRQLSEAGIAINDSIDDINNNQVYDAFILNVLNESRNRDKANIPAWAAGSYNIGDVVNHEGFDWYVGTGTTVDEPDESSDWVACPDLKDALREATKGVSLGGFLPANDLRDATNYNTTYKIGSYWFKGEQYFAYRLNIDGTVHVTASSTVGKILQYCKFKNLISSESVGNTTLEDFSALFTRSVDGPSGLTNNIGVYQQDAFQQFQLRIQYGNSGFNQLGATSLVSVLGTTDTLIQKVAGTAGAPREAQETRSSNFSQGVWGITIVVPASALA